MEPIKCKFSVVLENNQHEEILAQYLTLKNNVKLSNNCELELDENETKNYFIFSENIKFQNCNIKYDEKNNFLRANIIYTRNNKDLEVTFIIKNYKFKLQDKIFFCFESHSMNKYLDTEYKKKKFHLQIHINNITKKIPKEFLSYFNYSEFEIIYNYNYKPVTFKELTKEYAYTKKKDIKASDLNYEFANYIQLDEEDFNSFYYIDSHERKNFIEKIKILVGNDCNFIALCGPFGIGKTVTLLKMINDPYKRSYYINLWTIFNLEIDEIKNVLKYEYVKIIGQDFKEENENDEIIKYITKINSPKEIYDFISNIIISLNKMDEFIYYLIIDQYSSRYDENNENIKKLKKEVQGTKVIMIICSSMNNDDVKENLAYSFSPLEKDINRINYLYVGCLVKLSPLEKPLINESLEFQKVLSEFGNSEFYYYRIKEILRQNKDFARFISNEEKIIKKELERFYRKDEESKMKIEIAKIIYYINEKEIFLYNNIKETLLKLPLKFLEIKTQQIPCYKLINFAKQNGNFELVKKIENYISDDYDFMEAEEESIINFINKGTAIDEEEISNENEDNKIEKNINIFFLEGLFPHIVDFFSKIIYNDSINITKTFFSELSAQTQGGIIEFYLLEYIRHRKQFFNIQIEQFESIEVLVPNEFFFQNYSSRKEDTIYDYYEKENFLFEGEYIHKRINLPNKNILLKQNQFTGKYYDFSILIYSEKEKGFFLVLFQVSKKKINTQILYKEEHEITLNRVKNNIESVFNIKIISGYFCYIFTNFSKNNKVISFCEKYKIPYLEFSFQEMKFNIDKPFNLNDCLITNNFPFHNCFSIVSEDKFKFKNILDENNYDEIIKYKSLFTFQSIKNTIKNDLKWTFKVGKKSKLFDINNDYAIFGFFNEMKKFSNKFCIWYNCKQKIIYYYDNGIIKTISNKNYDFSDVNTENKEWILICSKYKYKLITKADGNNWVKGMINKIRKNYLKKKI